MSSKLSLTRSRKMFKDEHSPASLLHHIIKQDASGVEADLAAGVDPNAIDTTIPNPDLPLRRAVEMVIHWHPDGSCRQIVEALLKAGANPNLPNPPGSEFDTPVLYQAVNWPSMFEMLLLGPEAKIKADPTIMITDTSVLGEVPPGVPVTMSLKEYITRSWPSPRYDTQRQRMLDALEKALRARSVDVKKILNRKDLPPDMIRKIAEMDTGQRRAPQPPPEALEEYARGAPPAKRQKTTEGGRSRSTRKRRRLAKKTRKNRK